MAWQPPPGGIMPFQNPNVEAGFLGVYDAAPHRIVSDRWWAAVIVAQTYIIEFFGILEHVPDHLKLIITAQAAGALLVFAFSFNALYPLVYRRPVLNVVRVIGALVVLTVPPYLYLTMPVTSWWGIPNGFLYRATFMYGRFLDVMFLAFRWQLGISIGFVLVQTAVVLFIVRFSHFECSQLLENVSVRARLSELKGFGARLNLAEIIKTCTGLVGGSIPGGDTVWTFVCNRVLYALGAVARMPALVLCIGLRCVLTVLLGLLCPMAVLFRQEYKERKQYAAALGLPVPISAWPTVVYHFAPVAMSVAGLVLADRVLALYFG